jgi:hypothetical protein
MQDQRNWRAGAGAGVKASFEASLGAGKNDFGHEFAVLLAYKGSLRGCAAAFGPI